MTLHYYEPGKRAAQRKASRKVSSVREASDWMAEQSKQGKAFFPAEVRTGWGKKLVAAFI